jgi:hypothetical protein
MKKLTILTIFMALGFAVVACGGETTTTEIAPGEYQIPLLSNPDAVFYSTDNYEITYRDLYNSVKINDGLNQLLSLVDTGLLSDYLDDVTDEQIAAKRLKLTYDTDDTDEIAKMDDEVKEKYETNFDESMYLMGYTEDNYNDYIRLAVARELYVIDYMQSDATAEEAWHVGVTEIANYYDANYVSDIQSIKIKFNSEADAKAVMRHFNLISRNGKLMLYTGIKPIDQVPSFDFNETNTQELSEAEILEYYIKMYNYVYDDFRDALSETATPEELIADDNLTINYRDMRIYNLSLANFIFFSLGNYEDYEEGEEDTSYYTYKPERYYSGRDTAYYMIYNLTGYEKEDVYEFEGTEAELKAIIGADIYDEMRQEMIDANLESQSFVQRRMADLRREHEFMIYDYYMTIDYKAIDTEFVEDETGSLTILASYDDVEITPDQLLTHALNLNAQMYLVYTAQLKAVRTAHYEDVYCLNTVSCEYDYLQNESAKMIEHLGSYDGMESQFAESMYSTYYSFEDYLYLAYGVKNKEEMINNYYVKATLQPIYIFDLLIQNDYDILNEILAMIQPYYDNYFSLDVNHLLIYIDRDENGTPDRYKDFYAELEDTTEFDTKLAAFEVALRAYLEDDTKTLLDLVTEYKQASREDETWGEFKNYGFFVLTENLSSSESLTYGNSVNKYEHSFVDALIEMYQDYKLEANVDSEFIYSDDLIETSYGVHLIRAAKGDDFDMPSAEFEMTYDEDNEPEYLEGLVNDSEYISFDQLRIFAQNRFATIAFGTVDIDELYGFTKPTLPDDITDSLNMFAKSLHDALYVVGYLNIGVMGELRLGDFDNEAASYFSGSQSDLFDAFTGLEEIYNNQIFQDLDVRE